MKYLIAYANQTAYIDELQRIETQIMESDHYPTFKDLNFLNNPVFPKILISISIYPEY